MLELQLIRNATLRLNYAGHQLLIDPYFAPKHNRDPLVGKSRNPMIDLPLSIEAILDGVELVIISHLHFDHFDPVAQDALPKEWQLICQPNDQDKIASFGFTNVKPLADTIQWNNITITRTIGQHGTGEWLKRMGSVMGFVLQAEGEPTVYWTGDTIWIDAIDETIQQFQPDVIVTHSSGSSFEENSPIVMNIDHTLRVCQSAPSATIIAVHMEAIDHGTVSREALRSAGTDSGIDKTRLRIPDDGEKITLGH